MLSISFNKLTNYDKILLFRVIYIDKYDIRVSIIGNYRFDNLIFIKTLLNLHML